MMLPGVEGHATRAAVWMTALCLTVATAGPQTASSPQPSLYGGQHDNQNANALRPADKSNETTLNCPTDRKNFDVRGNTQATFEEVASQFGLEVAFDVDLRSVPIRFQVNNLDCATALKLLAATTGTFWTPLTSRMFFVAEDTPQKRKDYEISLVETFILPASQTPEDMTEIFRAVREITGVTRSSLNVHSHTLSLHASSQALAVAGALISNLERPAGELILEIEVLEIDRHSARDFGIMPPQGSKIFGLSSQEIQEAEGSYEGLVDAIDQIFGSTFIPPVVAFGGGASTFLAELPNVAANFSEALALVRQGRRLILRAKDRQPATFFVGDRIPVALSSYSPGLSSGTSNGSSDIPPISNYPTGNSPSFVTTGSLRNNGIDDLVVANSADNTVSVLLGNGDGTFQNQVTYPTGTNPVGIATGEFDSTNDDYLDLAAANKLANTISILLGKGDGTFQAQTSLKTGKTPVSVIAANFHDLTSSSEVDLAVANEGDDTISIFRGNGDGTFKVPTLISLPSGYRPAGLAATDLNDDGHVDLVVADAGNNTISVLLGNGDGTFQQRTDYSTGDEPVYVAFGDFNGDNAPDIAVANQSGNSVSIYYNQENSSGVPLGTFVAGSTRDFSAGNGPTSIAVADYNLDGNADLAVSDQTDNAVTVLLNDGNESFTALSEVPVGNGPVSITSADFNVDGRPDAATADIGAAEATVILNSASLFGSGNTSGSPNSIFPGVQYLDVGLKAKLTPRVHSDNSVTLDLDFEMSSLTGQSFNTIPVISNESLSQTVRVNQNETAVIGSFLQQQVSTVVNGTPGISTVPGVGLIDQDQNAQDQKTERLILVTPRMVRLAPRENHRVYAGKGSLDGHRASETTRDEREIVSPARQRPVSPQP